MKIAITSSGKDLNSTVDPRFGRCSYFIIVDADSMEFKSVDNPAVTASGGAGIQAAQMIADEGVEAVITGNVGPNAIRTLSIAGIEVYSGARGTIEDTIKLFKEGELTKADSATVNSHAGISERDNTRRRW